MKEKNFVSPLRVCLKAPFPALTIAIMSDCEAYSDYESEAESDWEDEPLANEDVVDDDGVRCPACAAPLGVPCVASTLFTCHHGLPYGPLSRLPWHRHRLRPAAAASQWHGRASLNAGPLGHGECEGKGQKQQAGGPPSPATDRACALAELCRRAQACTQPPSSSTTEPSKPAANPRQSSQTARPAATVHGFACAPAPSGPDRPGLCLCVSERGVFSTSPPLPSAARVWQGGG